MFSRAVSGLGKAAGYTYDLITDPWKAAARGLAYVPEPIREYQDTIDAPQDDGLEPETAFGYELPWNKAQTRGFKAGTLDAANLGTIAEVGALAASGGMSGLASLGVRAGLKAPALIRGANTAARISGQVSRASDYAGIAGGGLETVEGLREGDYGRAAVGAGMAGLGGVSRYTSQPRADAPRANDFWTEFAQEAPERPAQTPLERVRKDEFDTLFADETPIGPAAQQARTAAEPAPTFSPAKPRAGQSTLQPVSDLPVSAAPAGSAASRAARARGLNPRRQDPGVLPQARAGMDDSAALDQFFETGVDPLDVPPPPADVYDLGELADPAARPELDDDLDELAGLFGNEVPIAASMRPKPGYRSTPETRPLRKDLVTDLKERRAIKDMDDGRGSTAFDPVELETGVAAEVPVPVTRPMNPELKAMIEADVNARPANDVNEYGPAPETPVLDVLPTGEAQPRLPGDTGAVRDTNVPTPKLGDAPEQSFNLAPPPVKPPAQPDLPQGLPEGTPTLPKASIPTNVRDYLVKRLGWSPEAVNAMTPEQAVNAGKAQQRPPEGQGQAPKPKAPQVGSVVQAPSPLSTRDVPITKTGPRGEITVGPEAAAAPATLAARATPEPPGPLSAREKGTNPRAVEQANAAGKRFVETGNDADLDTWATGVAREADEAGKQAVKAGHKVSLDGGTKIHSNPLADPELWKKAARVLTKTPAGRFYLGAVGGALVGHDQDDPWSETAKNAVLGGLAASLANRKTAKEVMAALERRRLGTGLYGERGVRPVLPEAGEKWSAWDKVRSPQRSIPDVMRKVQPKFEVAEQAIRGFDAEGKPIKGFKTSLTPEEQKLAVKESLKDVRSTLRAEGKRLWEGGEKQKARLVRELLARVENRPTLLAELMGGGTGARRLDSFLAKAQYFQSLAWNMGLGRILNPTQKYFALNYVPIGAISKAKKLAKSPEGQARTDFLHVERASDDPDMLDLTFMESLAGDRFKQAQTLWERIMEKTGGNALRASDEMNRRVTYLAAADYAKEKGGVQSARGFDKSPEAIHRWAMDVVNQTQSVVGPMGQSPYVSRVGKSVTTFTKFSTLAMELAVDMVQNPRPETLGLIAVAASMAMANKALPDDYELDLVKMFAPRAMVSLPAYGQAKNALSQASNTAQGAVERTVRTLAPDSPERYYDELFGEGGFFGGGGMGTHRHPNRYGSVDEHSGTDALARMFGVETASNSERIVESQRQRNFQKRTQAESSERNRPKNQAAKAARIKRSKAGEASKDAIRRGVPVKDRKEYDRRFGAQP